MAKKKAARFKKGSAAAKAFMAKLRSMQGGRKRRKTTKKKTVSYKFRKDRANTPWTAPAVTRSPSSAEKELKKLRAKGRRVAKSAGIKPFYFTGKQPQLVVSEGDFMAKRKVSKRRKARVHGFDGRKRRATRRYHGGRRRSRRHVLMGGIGSNIPKLLMQGAIGTAGAVGSAFIASKLPVPAKFKPAIPLAVAIALLTVGKKVPMAPALAFGCAVSGVMGFVKQFAPTVPLLAGVDSAPELSADDIAMLGGPQTFGAVQELTGAVSPADM